LICRHFEIPASHHPRPSLPGYCVGGRRPAIDRTQSRKNFGGCDGRDAGLAPDKFYAARKICRDLDTWLGGRNPRTSIFPNIASRSSRKSIMRHAGVSTKSTRVADSLSQREGADRNRCRMRTPAPPPTACGEAIVITLAALVKTATARQHQTRSTSWKPRPRCQGLGRLNSWLSSTHPTVRGSPVNWGCEVVAIPDTIPTPSHSLDRRSSFSGAMACHVGFDPDPEPTGRRIGVRRVRLLRYAETTPPLSRRRD